MKKYLSVTKNPKSKRLFYEIVSATDDKSAESFLMHQTVKQGREMDEIYPLGMGLFEAAVRSIRERRHGEED